MNAPRIIPAGPMGHGDILPLIREVGHLRERGEYQAAAELEERIRQPITVAGRTLDACLDGGFHWSDGDTYAATTIIMLAYADEWRASVMTNGPDILHQCYGKGPTIAATLSDARERYQAAIGDTLLRMGGLLREVGK